MTNSGSDIVARKKVAFEEAVGSGSIHHSCTFCYDAFLGRRVRREGRSVGVAVGVGVDGLCHHEISSASNGGARPHYAAHPRFVYRRHE